MEIPDWLLFEVLLRLPVNCVFKCRIVSKQWLSLASDPYFIRAYASRASCLFPGSWIVLAPYVLHESTNQMIPLETYPGTPRLCSIRIPCRRGRGNMYYEVVGASDGLVLYRSFDREPESGILDFWVCNPITGHQIKPVALRVPYLVHRWWGFLARGSNYRIVLATKPMEHELSRVRNMVVTLNVYYSETGDWKEFKVDVNHHRVALQRSAAVVNEVLHWADTKTGVVIAYDPDSSPERIRLIEGPKVKERLKWCLCVAHRGGEELRYFGGSSKSMEDGLFPRFTIWKLLDSQWCLEHKIEGESMQYIHHSPMKKLDIVCFDPFDSDVVYLINEFRKYFSYNLKSGVLDHQCKLTMDDGIFNGSWFSLLWKLLLVLPPWPKRVAWAD